MLLHVAIYCLTSWQLASSHCDYANSLLRLFVNQFSEICGKEGVIYNVHNLCHLADDCKKYGALDSISAFQFENYLKTLKNLVRHGHNPLQQISRRFSEGRNLIKPNHAVRRKNQKVASLSIGRDFDLCTTRRNCNVLVHGGVVVVCVELYTNESGKLTAFDGRRYRKTRPLYDYPLASDMLDIHVASKLSSKIEHWPFDAIQAKCMLLPLGEEVVCIPMQHTVL